MKLNYITMSVRYIEKSLKFYQKLIEMENMDKVEVKGMVLSFQTVETLDDLRNKALRLGYDIIEVIHHPTKPTYYRVIDPDEMIIEFSND